MALSDRDESVRIAVRVLGDMRNGTVPSPSSSFQPTPALSITSGMSSPSLPSPTFGGEEEAFIVSHQPTGDHEEDTIDRDPRSLQSEDKDFVSRVSNIPLVNSALRAYEHSKASSRMVKYGAEMMESSVKSISKPVIDRLPVNQLDEFACRQLDRFGTYTRQTQSQDRGRSSSVLNNARNDQDVSMVRSRSRSREGEKGPLDVESNARSESRAPTPRSQTYVSRPPTDHTSTTEPAQGGNPQSVAQRSTWQSVLLEAGGISAAVSEESMRRLKYCLQWLQYATAHIDNQILVLRNFIASLQPSASSCLVSAHHLRILNAAKRDVVETLRQVIDIVSRYAGGALPEPARMRVRTFILSFPQRWAAVVSEAPIADGRAEGRGSSSGVGRGRPNGAPYTYGPGEPGPSSRSRPASPSSSRSRRGAASETSGRVSVDTAHAAAEKILKLATESLDMLRGVTGVFRESLDRADAWVERLRVVGVQRMTSGELSEVEGDLGEEMRRFRESREGGSSAASPQASTDAPPSPTSPYAPLSTISSGRSTPHSQYYSANSGGGPSPSGSSYSLGHAYGRYVYDAASPGAGVSLDGLSLAASAPGTTSRLSTPKISALGLLHEGDGDAHVGAGEARGGKRTADAQDGDDPAVVAATALAGLAGSVKRIKREDDTMNEGRVTRMEVEN